MQYAESQENLPFCPFKIVPLLSIFLVCLAIDAGDLDLGGYKAKRGWTIRRRRKASEDVSQPVVFLRKTKQFPTSFHPSRD
jgi:hypothetical protein